jgi:hypothetical protein
MNNLCVYLSVCGTAAACPAQVYRGTWTNIDIAAKEYLAVDECETAAGKTPSELAMQRARVSKSLPACVKGPASAYM